MTNRPNPYRLLRIAFGLGVTALACLLVAVAFTFLNDREAELEPDQHFHFQGKIEGMGPVQAWLWLDDHAPSLQLLSGGGREFVMLAGEREGTELFFGHVDRREHETPVNRMFRCTALGSPLALAGKLTDSLAARVRDFELQPAATYEALRTRKGFRVGQRGWRASFSAAFPLFLDATELETEAMAWVREEMDATAKAYRQEMKPDWSEWWYSMRHSSATAEWVLEIVWYAEYRSPRVLSLRADHYSYTGGAHGNLETECQTFWRRGEDVERLVLSDLFKPDSDWAGRLSELIIEDLKRQGADWVISGERRAFTSEDLPAFTLSNFGITFHFDPYAVGPYAEGRYRVFVPFNQLEQWLRPEGVIQDVLPASRRQF